MHTPSALALLLATAPSAGAQRVNIGLDHTNPNPTPRLSSAFAVAAGQPGHWMNITTYITTTQINGLDALPSGITLTRTSGAVTACTVNNASTTWDHEAVLDDIHGFNSATSQFMGVDLCGTVVVSGSVNDDAVVNSADLSVFLANFGATCF